MRTRWILTLTILSLASLLGSCSGKPENRAGTWKGTSQFGDFTFKIDETGNYISHISFDLKCETGTMSNSFDMVGDQMVKLKGDRFNIITFMFANVPGAEWDGKFSGAGTKARGTLSVFGGNCKTSWTAERLP
jgi:hypothetical protein